MTTKPAWELPGSEAELTALTRELDQAHRASLPAMRARAAEYVVELRDAGAPRPGRAGRTARFPARRGFLLGLGGLGATAALSSCSPANQPSPDGRAASAGTTYTGDLRTVALATALENQAVTAYKTALANGKAGKLGTVPPAATEFMQTAMGQHQDHAKAWNSVLTGAGLPAITGVPLANQAATMRAVDSATSTGAVAKLALGLENQATETYLAAIGRVKSSGGIETSATIAPVEAMHAAVLMFVLGQYPVPRAFVSTSGAADPNLLTA